LYSYNFICSGVAIPDDTIWVGVYRVDDPEYVNGIHVGRKYLNGTYFWLSGVHQPSDVHAENGWYYDGPDDGHSHAGLFALAGDVNDPNYGGGLYDLKVDNEFPAMCSLIYP